MLPGKFLESEKCKNYVLECLKNDFLLCLKNIRKGFQYVAPCNSIAGLFSNFAKTSCDHVPYGFYRMSKSVALACLTDIDKPVTSIKLKSINGHKDLFLFKYRIQAYTSAYLNLYLPLMFTTHGDLLMKAFGRLRSVYA